MKLAIIGNEYDITPVSSVDEVINILTDIYKFKKPKAIACTFTFNPATIQKLANICDVLRVFVGKGVSRKVGGAYITKAQTHFKVIYMWDDSKTSIYLGSGNLGVNTGYADYGILVTKNTVMSGFNTKININNFREWNDPFDVIMCDLITRETGSRCEICGNLTDTLYLDNNGKLVCENDYSG